MSFHRSHDARLIRALPALLVALVMIARPARVRAAAPLSDLTFERDIRPILKANCFHCHGETDKPKGGVDLRLRRFMLTNSESGPILVPRRPEESVLLQKIRTGEMPKRGKSLPPEQVALIERWIGNGAPTRRPEPAELPHGFRLTEEDREFWSFRPIQRPPLPSATHLPSDSANPVDRFIADKLAASGLDFAPTADRRTLIRRVYLDLLGLPPGPDEIGDFLADSRPDAYERLVDRLLASPRYGERWGRHWLDAAGYADSNGFTEADSLRPHAWRYRDYVIRSFNDDKPWDRFIVEQLAGDELVGATQDHVPPAVFQDTQQLDCLVATGFLRMAPDGTGDEVPDQNLARNQVMADTLKVVSTSLLGLTVGCAQCHDHRYDPISQMDYHRLRAIFEPGYDWKNWRTPGGRLVSLYRAEDRAQAEAIEAEARKLDVAAEALYKAKLEAVFERELKKVPEDIRETVRTARNTARDKRSAEQKELFLKYPAADVQGALDLYDPEANKLVLAEREKATKLRGTKPSEPFLMALTEVAGKVPDTFLFNRGDHDQPRDKVAPGELEVLSPPDSPPLSQLSTTNSQLPSTGRRLAYARWLTSGEHPLVARVLVNRIWLHHFGRGLVNTPGDFGALGERPTHPELLDWLAADFMDHGWTLKELHRLLLTSRTFRQSAVNDASSKADPDNKLFARFRLQRLDAEALRDAMLAVSGSLNTVQFGEPVAVARDPVGRVVTGTQKRDGNGDPVGVEPLGGQDGRRSIYVQARRKMPLTTLDTFDAPVMSPNCEARASTTVAPQSLLLMNDSFVTAQATQLAERLRREHPGEVPAQLAAGWRRACGEAPDAATLTRCLDFYNRQAEQFRARPARIDPQKPAPPDDQQRALSSFCQVLLTANRFLYVE